MTRSIRAASRQALNNEQLQRNLRRTLGQVRHSRDIAVGEVDNWQQLRQYAHDVKEHTLARLPKYLLELEEAVQRQGGAVVWAETAAEANEFVVDLAFKNDIRALVKSKSMLGEELRLNRALEQAGIEAVETDLGEYIVQLAGQDPSHIIAPAVHLSKEQVAELFHRKLQMEKTTDIKTLTATARRIMRTHFLRARLGVTGVNFAVSESGTIVVVENEGNARLSISAPNIHIAIMGLEKVIPRISDLSVFLKLLTRSATGQKITSYINLINGAKRPGELDGPKEFYLVIVDNGRTKLLQDKLMRQTLSCIRCGACLNVCPVYQHLGGHAYGSTYPGPIGAILTPQLESLRAAPEHPFASSLCGACHEVCPVKIEIPQILLRLRNQIKDRQNARPLPFPVEKVGFQIWRWGMLNASNYNRLSRWARRLQGPFKRDREVHFPFPPFSRWQRDRSLPELAQRSFRQLYDSRQLGRTP